MKRKAYYVYAYTRSVSSETAAVGTPYYIGKGQGYRKKARHSIAIPTDPRCVVLLAESLTEPDAHQLEMLLIHLYGRVDLGTGILRNLTDGGEGTSGATVSEATREKKRQKLKGIPRPESVIAKLRGRKRSPETIEKLRHKKMPDTWRGNLRKSALKRGPTMTEGGKARLREALSNRVVSAETGRKLSLATKRYFAKKRHNPMQPPLPFL